jgi:hypothetical protein
VGYSALGKLERVMPWRLALEQYAAIFRESRIDNTVRDFWRRSIIDFFRQHRPIAAI